jgi:hypothetical protein
MTNTKKSSLTAERASEVIVGAVKAGRITALFKALGMTGVKLVTDQGEWELPDGDFVFLLMNTRSTDPTFGAEMVGSKAVDDAEKVNG